VPSDFFPFDRLFGSQLSEESVVAAAGFSIGNWRMHSLPNACMILTYTLDVFEKLIYFNVLSFLSATCPKLTRISAAYFSYTLLPGQHSGFHSFPEESGDFSMA